MSDRALVSPPDLRAKAATQSKLLIASAAGLSFCLSIYLFFSGEREQGIFVGLWVPSILSAGNLLFAGEKR